MRPAAKPPARAINRRSSLPAGLLALVLVGLAMVYPPFHVISLSSHEPSGGRVSPGTDVFAPRAFAVRFWESDLPGAASRATDAVELDAALDRDAKAAAERYAVRVGLGGVAYYFIAGEGRVVGIDKTAIRIAVGDTDKPFFLVGAGPVFGNALRDGTGLLDLNAFPGSAEFNALSAELNQLVESRVLPLVQGKVAIGTRIRFAGCAEITGLDGDPRPLQLVPFLVELR